jgi:hypothetical protein
MSLILGHIDGVQDDDRLENLQIVCPDCGATRSTHCARNQPPTTWPTCGGAFRRRSGRQRYCSQRCRQESHERRALASNPRDMDAP